MTLNTALGLEALTDHELLKVLSSSDVLSERFLRDLSFTAIIKPLAQYIKSFSSSYSFFFQEAHINAVPNDLALCGPVQGSVESGCRRCVRVTKLMRCFPEAPRPIEKINDEAAGTDSASARSAFGGTYFDNAVPYSAEEHDVLLVVKAVAAHNQDRKQNPPTTGRFIYS